MRFRDVAKCLRGIQTRLARIGERSAMSRTTAGIHYATEIAVQLTGCIKALEAKEEKILQSATPTNTQSEQALREIAISSKIREYAKENSIHIMDYDINGITSQLLTL